MKEPKQFAVELKKRLEELRKAQLIGQAVGLIPLDQPSSSGSRGQNSYAK